MEIILLEDVRRLGQRGDVVRVKPGFARNYLLPKGSALEATKGNRAYFEQQRKKIDARHTKKRNEAAEIAARIAEINLKVAKRVGEKETLYGSVTTAEIADLLEKKGVTVDKRRIDLGGVTGLKSLGEHKVAIDLHPEVVAELVVTVVPEE
ncbi:MAG: 50S ribosomal protein L9 [Acidobacteriota bacterium]